MSNNLNLIRLNVGKKIFDCFLGDLTEISLYLIA